MSVIDTLITGRTEADRDHAVEILAKVKNGTATLAARAERCGRAPSTSIRARSLRRKLGKEAELGSRVQPLFLGSAPAPTGRRFPTAIRMLPPETLLQERVLRFPSQEVEMVERVAKGEDRGTGAM